MPRSKLDLEELRIELQHLNRFQKIYMVLKEELGKLGYWRNKARGNPAKGYAMMRTKKAKND